MRRRTLLECAKNWPRLRPGVPRHPHSIPVVFAQVGQWFHVFSDAPRVEILTFLVDGSRSVGELERLSGMTKSATSFHLKVLRESGLVQERREGSRKYQSLRWETVAQMIAFLDRMRPGTHGQTCPLSCCQS